jgi:hypothetical protein
VAESMECIDVIDRNDLGIRFAKIAIPRGKKLRE